MEPRRRRGEPGLEELADDAERIRALEVAAPGREDEEAGVLGPESSRREQRALAHPSAALDHDDPAVSATGGALQTVQQGELALPF